MHCVRYKADEKDGENAMLQQVTGPGKMSRCNIQVFFKSYWRL